MTPVLHTGDVIKVRQGSMELYRVCTLFEGIYPHLEHIGNDQHKDNATRYPNAIRVYPGLVTVDGVAVRIEIGLNGRPRVVA